MRDAAEDAGARAASRPLAQVEEAAYAAAPARDVLTALSPADRVKIIAEVKRASPSRGDLAAISDPAGLAREYESAGASAISVLTEHRRFKGSLDDLETVHAAVGLPVLRKDFISSSYQVYESRAAGADLVLLIVAGLSQESLASLHGLVTSLGMAALVEAHSADEVSRAADAGAQIIGVNARNLSTFELDRDLFGRLADGIPAGVVKIAESAVHTADDVARYRSCGADVVLIGEALVTAEPAQTLRRFLAA